MTDSGRPVYGGGGITPDVKIPPEKTNDFQERLLQHYAFFNFARHYTVEHKAGKDFQVTPDVMQAFRSLLTEQKIPWTESELTGVEDWVKDYIQTEVVIDSAGQEEGMKVQRENDPEVKKALELLPQAKALADGARKIIAERGAARNTASNTSDR
jgi:carboxyl-terminal processing protease